MRVTMSMLSERLRLNLMTSCDELLKAQHTATTGKRISTPSDDPIGAGKSLSLRSVLSSIDQYARNVDVANSQLSVTSAAMDSVVASVQQLRSLALSAASPALTTEARSNLAIQIDQIAKTLATTGNMQHMGKYIFAGSRSDAAPIVENPAGTPPYLYQGDSSQMSIRVGADSYVAVNVTGDRVFNIGSISAPGAPDIFTTIGTLRDAVLAADITTISAQLGDIDLNLSNMIATRSQVGERLRRLDQSREALLDAKTSASELLSLNEDADLAEALVALRVRENVYEAAIGTATRLLSVSLAEMLK